MKYVVNIKKEEHPKMTTSNIIVLVAFAFYMLVMIAIGVVYSKKTKNNEDYFLGGRNLGGWTAALSAQASDMSGWLLMVRYTLRVPARYGSLSVCCSAQSSTGTSFPQD